MRPVTKEVKRFNAQGGITNYGSLAVGVHLGIECLGKREGLLALGIKLVNKKPPAHFETSLALSVKVNPHLDVTVYVVDGNQLDRLGYEISVCGYWVYAVPKTQNGSFLRSWENGRLVYSSTKEAPSSPQPGKEISVVRRLWFKASRLFSKR